MKPSTIVVLLAVVSHTTAATALECLQGTGQEMAPGIQIVFVASQMRVVLTLTCLNTVHFLSHCTRDKCNRAELQWLCLLVLQHNNTGL